MAQRKGKPIGDLAQSLVNGAWTSYYQSQTFMPAGPPLPVQIVQTKKQDIRNFDFPAFFNMLASQSEGIEPDDDGQGLSFSEIRDFSENWEIVRLVIETCKDQLSKLRWAFRLNPIDNESAVQNRDRSIKDLRVAELNDFFKKPDKEHKFFQWIRMLLEELLVCDTVCIYRRTTIGGDTYSIDLVDCNTIKRLIDDDGKTPLPDSPYPDNIAYQQKIKGMIYAELTSDDLIYFVRNPRVSKVYGYGGIEQIITSINIGIRRMLFQLSTYTEGNIPAMFMKMPAEWTKEEVREFQIYWNTLMSGNLGDLSKGWAIPGDADPVFPQKDVLKDSFDEWLARVACYAYSVSPNAFITSLNRATSEQSREQADEEGLQMRMFLVQQIMNEIISKWWGFEDIEFHLQYDRPQDSLKQAEIDNYDIRNGVKGVDEVRRERGLPPIGAPPRVYLTNGIIPLTDGDKGRFAVFQQEIIQQAKPPVNNTTPADEPPAKA